MRRLMIAAAAGVFVAGCSEDAPVKQEETAAAKPSGGQYEASWKVTQVRSVDKTTPATNLNRMRGNDHRLHRPDGTSIRRFANGDLQMATLVRNAG